MASVRLEVGGGLYTVRLVSPIADNKTEDQEVRRPGETGRNQLMQTAAGRRVIEESRRALSELLAADGRVPLSALRLSRGMSQVHLAELSGIRQPQLSRLESGLHEDVMVATLERLARALGVDIEEVNNAVRASRQVRPAGVTRA